MATKTNEARAKVTLDSSSFEGGAKSVAAAAEAMGSAVKKAFAVAGAAVVSIAGMRAIANAAQDVLELGERMANAGNAARISAGHMYLFAASIQKGVGLGTMAKLIGENGEALQRSANTFRDVSIKLWAVGEKIRGFWIGLMERVAPVLSKLLDGALGKSLVDAGNSFGDAIVSAVAVFYQLAEDGKLWETIKSGFKVAFEYAGERMIWLAGLGYKLLKEIFSQAFVDGITAGIGKMWDAVKGFAEYLGMQLVTAFQFFWVKVIDTVYSLISKLDSLLVSIGLMSEEEAGANRRGRAEDIGKRSQRILDIHDQYQKSNPEGKDLASRISEIFSNNQFQMSDRLAEEMGKIGSVVTQAKEKGKAAIASMPAQTFENRNFRALGGSDSLTAMGGGGGVHLGLTSLEINKMQLNELRSIKEVLQNREFAPERIPSYNIARPSYGVSRAQTSSPTQSH